MGYSNFITFMPVDDSLLLKLISFIRFITHSSNYCASSDFLLFSKVLRKVNNINNIVLVKVALLKRIAFTKLWFCSCTINWQGQILPALLFCLFTYMSNDSNYFLETTQKTRFSLTANKPGKTQKSSVSKWSELFKIYLVLSLDCCWSFS